MQIITHPKLTSHYIILNIQYNSLEEPDNQPDLNDENQGPAKNS